MIDEAKQAVAVSLVDAASDILCSAALHVENGRRLDQALRELTEARSMLDQAMMLVKEMKV